VCLLLGITLFLAGCAAADSSSEKDKRDGFYGGFLGGSGM
jgi:hypothetical protein